MDIRFCMAGEMTLETVLSILEKRDAHSFVLFCFKCRIDGKKDGTI